MLNFVGEHSYRCRLHCRNLLIVLIVPRAAVRVSRSAKLYYSVIAVADALELLVGTVLWSFLDDGLLLLTGNRFSLRIARYSHATCKLFYLLFELTESLSNYTIVSLALERCLIIFFPLRAKRFVRLRFSVMLIAMVVAPAWLVSFIVVPIIVKLNTEMQQASQSGCECEKDEEHSLTKPFTIALTVLSYILHTILNIFLVILISVKLAHIRYQRNAMFRDNQIHLANRKINAISSKRPSTHVTTPACERRSASASGADSRIVNPNHLQQSYLNNNNNGNHNIQTINAAANQIELVQLTSDATANASDSYIESPRFRLKLEDSSVAPRSPCRSRFARNSSSPYKRISKDTDSSAISGPPDIDDSKSPATPKISISEINSSSTAKSSKFSADNSTTGSPEHCLQINAHKAAARLDSVPEHSVLRDCSCSPPEPRPSPRHVCKPFEEDEPKPEPESELSDDQQETESPWVLRRDVCREFSQTRPASSPSLSRDSTLLTQPARTRATTNGAQSGGFSLSPSPSHRVQIRNDPLVAKNSVVEPSSPALSRSGKYRNSRGAGSVTVISSSAPARAVGGGAGPRGGSAVRAKAAGGSDGGVGIGATVVMVLLAAINVSMYLPAAVVEFAYMLIDQDSLAQSTQNWLESLDRFLFENLCFAHALNFFVYVARCVYCNLVHCAVPYVCKYSLRVSVRVPYS